MHYRNSQLSFSKLAFVDIDNTLTGDGSGTGNPKSIMKVRELLKKNHYLYCPTTSRTEEMMMSQKSYQLSKKIYDFKRPEPKLIFEPPAILDGEIIISSSGSKIFVKQTNNAYQEDICFYNKDFPDPQTWRNTITTQINSINGIKKVFKLSPIEYIEQYVDGTSNAYPPDYRIQLNFTSVNDKLFFIRKLYKIKQSSKDISINKLYLTDDSNPEKNKFSLYLTPKKGKIDAVNHVIKHLQTDLKITILELLFVGDSWPDLQLGLFGATKIANATFLLIGGSRLTKYLINPEKTEFAGEPLLEIKNNLIPSQQKGVYYYKGKRYKRKIILGDIIDPGKIGPDSMIEFLS